MLELVVRRLAVTVPLLLLTSFLVFVLAAKAADPLDRLREHGVPADVVEARSQELHLDDNVAVRYGRWLSHAVRGDLGTSLDGRDVGTLLVERMQVTLRMVTLAALLAMIVGLAVGVAGAVRQYSRLDHSMTVLSFVGLSMPAFWIAGLLKEYLAVRLNRVVGFNIVFTVGDSDPGVSGGLWQRLGDYAGHLVLPTLALMIAPVAVWGRYVRSSMLDVLSADYVRAARAKGLSPARVVGHHALRNALAPFVTLVALDFGHLLAGAVVLERVFAWQGMGQMLLDGVRAADTEVVSAWLLATATAVFLCNLVADLVYCWLDPRVRHG